MEPAASASTRHCPRCGAEFRVARDRCSDCDAELADGPSPRFEREETDEPSAARAELPREGDVLLVEAAGDTAAVLADLLEGERIRVSWRDGRAPDPDGSTPGRFGLCVPAGELERANAVLARWGDVGTASVAPAVAAGPPAIAADPPPAPPPPTSELRHCPECGAEFVGDRLRCTDCDAALVDGPSTRFEPGSGPAADADHEERPTDADLEPFVALDDGEKATELCNLLADAGIPVAAASGAGRWLRAPGQAPIGEGFPAEGRVDVAVFSEDVDRAQAVLDGWPGRDAVVDEDPVEAEADEAAEPVRRELTARDLVTLGWVLGLLVTLLVLIELIFQQR